MIGRVDGRSGRGATVRKVLGLVMVIAAIAALTASPASAAHAGSVVAVNGFAGTCRGTAYEGGEQAGGCSFGNDPIWSATRQALDDQSPSAPCNPGNNGGGDTSGCGQGAYLPGFGPPVIKPSTPLNLDGRCTNVHNPSCWSGGNFINIADSRLHPLAICLFADASGQAGACRTETRGAFYRPLSGLGGYSGASEGCGRVYTESLAGTSNGDWTTADITWVHSAGTLLPVTGRVRRIEINNDEKVGHTGTSIFLLSNARSIAPTEPPGAGNAGLLDPGDSGTQRFSVNAVSVTLPGDGQDTNEFTVGQDVDRYCPELRF